MAFAVELWDLLGHAGVKRRDLKQMLFISEDDQEADEVAVMSFIDKELAGEGSIRGRPSPTRSWEK
jgi:hypothetical protein